MTQEEENKYTRKHFHLLGWITIIGFLASGWYYIRSDGRDPLAEFTNGINPALQVVYGLGLGIVCAFISCWFLKRKFMEDQLQPYIDLVKPFNLKMSDIVFVSLCAGVGEEYFFRAGLQPSWGIITTSIFFVAIHGYLNPFKKIFYYGIVLTLMICLMGWFYEKFGLISSMTAHALYDVIMFKVLVDMANAQDHVEIETPVEDDENNMDVRD